MMIFFIDVHQTFEEEKTYLCYNEYSILVPADIKLATDSLIQLTLAI